MPHVRSSGTRPESSLSLLGVVAGLSTALDLAFTDIAAHHARVAYIAVSLARSMGLDAEALFDLYIAASLHDLGAIGSPEMERLADFEVDSPWEHCSRGAAFLRECEIVAGLGDLLECHHDDWTGPNPSGRREAEIPLASRIIHLADRVDCMCARGRFVLSQRSAILRYVRSRSGKIFDPAVVEAFGDVSRPVQFWLDFGTRGLEELLDELGRGFRDRLLPAEAIRPLAGMFSRVIDSRSPYTREHSAFVAGVAAQLAPPLGFDRSQQSDLMVAGLLHDMGKLIVPEPILLKAGPLTEEETDIVKQHPYQTDRILGRIPGIGDIRRWASLHHERLDGQGYPFQLDRDSLPLGSQLLSVCDQFAALVQPRPYRAAMERESVARVMRRGAREGALNGDLVALLLERYDQVCAPAATFPSP
ncbi:MAG TPA: HD domain-containing phosphohydrolase [Anaeromyxobacteraceae bacterium]|jgi:HD-GYP domain-containing protein (c-di-GMP phosphodiesterase class II)